MGGFTPEGGEGLRVQAKQTSAPTDSDTHTHIPWQSPSVPRAFKEPEGQCGWAGPQGGSGEITSEVTGPECVESPGGLSKDFGFHYRLGCLGALDGIVGCDLIRFEGSHCWWRTDQEPAGVPDPQPHLRCGLWDLRYMLVTWNKGMLLPGHRS